MLSFLSRINMAANAMETDDLSHLPSNNLRRSNSAPNVSAAVMSEAIPIFQPLQSSRQRRFSTSQMALNVGSPASRIEQIKREESMDDASRERQVESDLSLSNSLNDWTLHQDKNNDIQMIERRNSFDEQRVAFPLSVSSSPPSQRGVTNRNARSLTPSPIPSPTRPTIQTHRSLSPVLRPSNLLLKRKCPSEGLVEPGVSPSKRLCDISPVNCSTDISCESTHLNFGDDNHSSSASDSSSSSSSSSSSLNATPMLLGELPRHPFRSKFTPPRSPLAGPSTSQNHPRTIGNSPSCFTFAPVRD
ncbi:P2R1A-PPP2R2A-interacting phosphatase regulator 1-like [Acropora palmata]|uniref:P2R1A-PPP2R2A-interacting phosphatase regulator 1-like n=1 Tax=Acropora palmata TaxID=6131 RepID=UPI003D9FFD0A